MDLRSYCLQIFLIRKTWTYCKRIIDFHLSDFHLDPSFDNKTVMSNLASDKETAQGLEHVDQVEIAPEAEDGKGALVKPKNHAYHAEQPKTPEEIDAEKRFVRKVDLWILPLLSIMYFLASLVSTSPTKMKTTQKFMGASDNI